MGIVLGWHYTDEIRKLLDDPAFGAQVHTVPTFDLILAMHAQNRFDGFLANPSAIAGKIGKKTLHDTYRMIRADIDVMHMLFSRIAVDVNLVERFNERLAARIENGFFLEVCKKYEDMIISSCDFLSTVKSKMGN